LPRSTEDFSRGFQRTRGPLIRGPTPDILTVKNGAVFKLRYRRDSGATDTIYYSDPKMAHAVAGIHEEKGSLIYFARYTLEEVLS
jgi:hypothetical protein